MAPKNAQEVKFPGQIVSAGDSAIIVRVGRDISLATHTRVMELLQRLDSAAPLPGVLDLVPAYASLMVSFDPLLTSFADIERHLRSILSATRPGTPLRRSGRLVRIPVEYGGAAGPDLLEVARLTGLLPEEVVQKHSGAQYRVYFLGFQAGFPYLGGLPPELAVPRLDRPRPQVPAGSVGLAGRQTGIYPSATPGGWQLIGRTPLRLFDETRNPPALLRPGDRVKFEAVPAATVDPPATTTRTTSRSRNTSRTKPGSTLQAETGVPWLAVRRPGPSASVQDLGRQGYARYGVGVSGAADTDALQLGNALLQNPPGAAALELTLGGGEFEVASPCLVALTGAECEAFCGGRKLPPHLPVALYAGDLLQLGPALRGVRVYLSVQGGVQVDSVLGSRSTDIRAGLGGLGGRGLRPGDILWRGGAAVSERMGHSSQPPRLPQEALHRPPTDGSWVIRILPGPDAASPPPLRAQPGGREGELLPGAYTVDPCSDRMGVRLRPLEASDQALPAWHETAGEMISEGVPRGAIQVPASGEPIILLADHQTTGGYPVRAVVASVDMWRVAQLRPGDRVHFERISLESAIQRLREYQERLRIIGATAALPVDLPPAALELLMRGFLEWSDEDG